MRQGEGGFWELMPLDRMWFFGLGSHQVSSSPTDFVAELTLN